MNGEQVKLVGSASSDFETDRSKLVLLIADGDLDAEAQFVAYYLPLVRTQMRARLKIRDHVDDIVQEVMIEALCALRRSQLRDPLKLTHFVLGIARNLLNNHFRRNARQPVGIDLPDDLPDLSLEADHAKERERQQFAHNAFQILESVDQSILTMTLVDGLKPNKIAQQLGLSSDVVRQRKVRATRRVVEFIQSLSQNAPPRHIISGGKP
jgi:RNA polymerase sigma factor (sigma-70 family)